MTILNNDFTQQIASKQSLGVLTQKQKHINHTKYNQNTDNLNGGSGGTSNFM